jgi:hypothetical protein
MVAQWSPKPTTGNKRVVFAFPFNHPRTEEGEEEITSSQPYQAD